MRIDLLNVNLYPNPTQLSKSNFIIDEATSISLLYAITMEN